MIGVTEPLLKDQTSAIDVTEPLLKDQTSAIGVTEPLLKDQTSAIDVADISIIPEIDNSIPTPTNLKNIELIINDKLTDAIAVNPETMEIADPTMHDVEHVHVKYAVVLPENNVPNDAVDVNEAVVIINDSAKFILDIENVPESVACTDSINDVQPVNELAASSTDCLPEFSFDDPMVNKESIWSNNQVPIITEEDVNIPPLEIISVDTSLLLNKGLESFQDDNPEQIFKEIMKSPDEDASRNNTACVLSSVEVFVEDIKASPVHVKEPILGGSIAQMVCEENVTPTDFNSPTNKMSSTDNNELGSIGLSDYSNDNSDLSNCDSKFNEYQNATADTTKATEELVPNEGAAIKHMELTHVVISEDDNSNLGERKLKEPSQNNSSTTIGASPGATVEVNNESVYTDTSEEVMKTHTIISSGVDNSVLSDDDILKEQVHTDSSTNISQCQDLSSDLRKDRELVSKGESNTGDVETFNIHISDDSLDNSDASSSDSSLKDPFVAAMDDVLCNKDISDGEYDDKQTPVQMPIACQGIRNDSDITDFNFGEELEEEVLGDDEFPAESPGNVSFHLAWFKEESLSSHSLTGNNTKPFILQNQQDLTSHSISSDKQNICKENLPENDVSGSVMSPGTEESIDLADISNNISVESVDLQTSFAIEVDNNQQMVQVIEGQTEQETLQAVEAVEADTDEPNILVAENDQFTLQGDEVDKTLAIHES